jgi:hypothetical protein
MILQNAAATNRACVGRESKQAHSDEGRGAHTSATWGSLDLQILTGFSEPNIYL